MSRTAMRRVLLALALLPVGTALAEPCGEDHAVRAGDTLSRIAERTYDDPQKWTVIYTVNLETIGSNPNQLAIGDRLSIPCLDAPAREEETSAPREAASPELADEADTAGEGRGPEASTLFSLLTGDGYEPFTDRALRDGGLIVALVDAALTATADRGPSRTVWINDWSAHLEPLLSEHLFDAGYPWYQPACDTTPDDFRCRHFLFSEPMFEILALLFTDSANPLTFEKDDDLHGKTLCRPAGYYTHDLEKNDRLWLTRELVELRQPPGVDDCFRLLQSGEVDAVALNEFTGRTAVRRLGLGDTVSAIDTRPLSIEGLHVVVHRQHPQAEALIERVNGGLASIDADGTARRIIDEHLAEFWAGIDTP